MDILRIVENTINSHSLIADGDRVLVALSGGADSALLLRVLCALGSRYNFTVAAAHINHQLRDTADRDEEFSKKLAKELGAEFYSKKIDVKALSKECGMGEEQYAREARYEFFASLGYDKIATAHNKNDVAETLLFNFMRGATTKGLSGIPYKRGNIIRPLLDLKKSEILEYSEKMGYSYVTDETNLEPVYSRNKIRLNLIPLIEREFNKSFVDVVTQNAKVMKEDSDYLDGVAFEIYKKGDLSYATLSHLEKPILGRICQLCYKEASQTGDNLSSVYIDKLITLINNNKTGSRISLPNKMIAQMEYGQLKIRKNTKKTSFKYDILPDVVLNIPEIGKNILIKETKGKGDFYLTDTDNLCIRSRETGDIFFPSGMTGRKKLSDFYTDKKIPATWRDKIPLLEKDGDIISVIGYRNDRRFQKGEKAYKIEITEE